MKSNVYSLDIQITGVIIQINLHCVTYFSFSLEQRAQRDQYHYMPFGLGPRMCLGNRLALMEIKIAFITILQQFKLATCAETEVSNSENHSSALGIQTKHDHHHTMISQRELITNYHQKVQDT